MWPALPQFTGKDASMSSEDSKVTLATTMPLVAGTTRVFGTIAHPADHVRAPT